MSSSSPSTKEVLSYLADYRRIVKETQALHREIRLVRQRLKPSIDRLAQEKKACEAFLLKYLTEHNEKGIKYQDMTLSVSTLKRYQPQKEKSRRLEHILEAHHITNTTLLDELTQLIHRQKVAEDGAYALKLKVVDT